MGTREPVAEASCDRPAGPSWRLNRRLEPSPAQQTLPRPGVAAGLVFGGEQDPACPHFQHWEGAHECWLNQRPARGWRGE